MKFDEFMVGPKVECRFDPQSRGPVWEPVGPRFCGSTRWLPTSVLCRRKEGRRSYITISIGIMASSDKPGSRDITRDVPVSWLRKTR